jgi:hypothetical protein
MNAKAKMAVGYAFAVCLLAFFVALLTVIFSFLGTFICAALAGMMMGAGRIRVLPSTVLSLLFPVVLVVTFRLSHTEIMAGHILLLALICLAVFWGLYGAIRALISTEQKSNPAVASHTETIVKAMACQIDPLPVVMPQNSCNEQRDLHCLLVKSRRWLRSKRNAAPEL